MCGLLHGHLDPGTCRIPAAPHAEGNDFKLFVPALPDVIQLSHAEKETLILALWQRLEEAERRIAELEAMLAEPPKTPNNSSLPQSDRLRDGD